MTDAHAYAVRAADPVVPDCPVAWPWHVVGTDEPDCSDHDPSVIRLEYDLDVYDVWPGEPCIEPMGSWVAAYDRPLDVSAARGVSELRTLPGAMLVISGGWLPRSISRALAEWTATYAGRADVRFRWNPAHKSAVLTAVRRYTSAPEASDPRSHQWIALRPAPQVQLPLGEADTQERLRRRNDRKELRVAEARRWGRRMRVDPTLAWLTPAEARMLADLGPAEDVMTWARQHNVRIAVGRGIEPVLDAARLLVLAQL